MYLVSYEVPGIKYLLRTYRFRVESGEELARLGWQVARELLQPIQIPRQGTRRDETGTSRRELPHDLLHHLPAVL